MLRIWLAAAFVAAAIPFTSLAAEPADTNKTDKVLQKLDEVLNRLDALDRARTDATREIRDLRAQVDLLARDVAELRSQMSPQRSTSAKMSPMPALGTVRLFNDYPTMMSVSVNGFIYDLMPGETRSIAVNAGSFSLQVFGVHPLPVTRTVADGKTYFTRIHPIGQ